MYIITNGIVQTKVIVHARPFMVNNINSFSLFITAKVQKLYIDISYTDV